ncbi:MAG TPA: NAD(P)-dependent alcohol dehydrogenase, partial [Polyangiaceae bacterium]
MKAIELTAPAPKAFRSVTLPDPKPQRGEVLVRVTAGSLNYIDLAVARGHYPVGSWPIVPVADGAGVVEEVGEDVSRFRAGDRVVLHSKPHWTAGAIDARTSDIMRGISLPGSLAEKVVLPETGMVPTPAHLRDEAAATLPIAATTAWNALEIARVRPGSTVLVLGTGVVSLFALQLAKARGASVIVTSSSQEKIARAKQLGADECVDYAKT